MEHYIYHVNPDKESKLFFQLWQPSAKPKAVICLVHGIGEHSSRYHEWAELFVEKNIAVVSYDQRGHGLSDGKRGVIPSYEILMDDIDFALKEVKKHFEDTPCFLYGHSMGGGEVLNHLITRKSNYLGVISTSPWIVTQEAPPKIVIPFLRTLSNLFPYISIKTSFDAKRLSHIEQVCIKYNEDELIHHMVSFRLFIDAYDAGYRVLKNPDKVKKPLLLLHGTDDQITDPNASKTFSEGVVNRCTYIQYNKAYHELHNEFCRLDVFVDIINWIETQLAENK
ncbi:alpha/beta hydrolase [Labilibaculum antarcticum]|uniref:Lysophospholipase n=1 Tax=Labilibaculum antarcticum TaxID=1717717 RepID=A0A1Y1CJ95_9BACT|nr:alpha/beta hydrolase [Labilibaculum antarcticum]BAX80404.1 lysophospholipase [Labilibaculum antarcticum]